MQLVSHLSWFCWFSFLFPHPFPSLTKCDRRVICCGCISTVLPFMTFTCDSAGCSAQLGVYTCMHDTMADSSLVTSFYWQWCHFTYIIMWWIIKIALPMITTCFTFNYKFHANIKLYFVNSELVIYQTSNKAFYSPYLKLHTWMTESLWNCALKIAVVCSF